MKIISLLFMFLVATISFESFGQSELSGSYIRTEYPNASITLNADKSFKFKFLFDLQWDLACGQYELKADTIYFRYSSDMFDSECNTERINLTDTSGVINRDAIDKRFRPISAKLIKNKIFLIQTGDIEEPATIESATYFYKREKKTKR